MKNLRRWDVHAGVGLLARHEEPEVFIIGGVIMFIIRGARHVDPPGENKTTRPPTTHKPPSQRI